ncbi:MAG: DUF6045 family protein [Eubacteriales bacterium]|nr:DUF6045 family protein [Eubacteriales bacterium]MDD4422590.1 DUF6045 family protein [Eubacteriales bacterium]
MFDWIGDLTGGIGDAISRAFSDLWATVSSSIWDVFLQWIYTAIYSGIADFFAKMGNMGVDMFGLSWVQAALKLFSLFGWALFVAGLVVTVFDFAIESQTGRINIRTAATNVLKGFFAVNLFTVLPVELYKFCISLQNIFSKDMSAIFASEASGNFDIAGAANSALTVLTGLPSFFNLFAMIALGYCVIKIFFANIKRGGILLIQIAVGSLYMFSVPRGYTDGFNQWCKQVIALCLTAFLQTTLLFLGLLTWQTDWLLAIGIMMAANEVPRIAQQFGLDTSARVNVMNAVHTTTTAVNITRSILKK